MAEYLAPGVYIEEVSYRAKSIEGVSTSTAGFVGPTRYGPTQGTPELVTSFGEFERLFGGLEALEIGGNEIPNFLAHGVRAFFNEGGRRAYIARVYNPPAAGGSDGRARASVLNQGVSLNFSGRWPGRGGEFRVTLTPRVSNNLLVTTGTGIAVQRVRTGDLVRVTVIATGVVTLGVVARDSGNLGVIDGLPAAGGGAAAPFVQFAQGMEVRHVTVDVEIDRAAMRPDRVEPTFEPFLTVEGLALDPAHPRSIAAVFAAEGLSRSAELAAPIVIEPPPPAAPGAVGPTGAEWALGLFGTTLQALGPGTIRVPVLLQTGSDGQPPLVADYEGSDVPGAKEGLNALADIEDISIVAAPGAREVVSTAAESVAVTAAIIAHCERLRYRVAVLDCNDDEGITAVRQDRAQFDSTYAAYYYPWVRIIDPITGEQVEQPPSGFVAGIYARNDVQHGVHKAPANEVVRSAIGFEFLLSTGQQEVLNPEGINCFRFFPGRGYRLWGARTISSDPEWKYVNVRRYFCYLERSIDRGTQWAVFENNGDALWANVRRTVEDFLFNEWKNGRLLGIKPEDAYFVKCDRSTMTQNDLDNGRLVCLVGVAPLRPAEFVIFRIGQWTADHQA